MELMPILLSSLIYFCCFFKLFLDVAKQPESPREFDLLLRGLGLWPI